jgi:hypothetical protein
MMMRLVWTHLLHYFARTDDARGCVDPSLPWLCRGKSYHDGGSGSRAPELTQDSYAGRCQFRPG